MLPPDSALSRAAATKRWAVGMCDNFVANMYGFTASGYATAVAHWEQIPGSDKHPGDQNAPAGALMFWGGGQGHVAISDGAGGIYSTDMPSSGTVSHVPASKVTNGWGKPYLGWSTPYFQGQAGTTKPAGNWIPGPAPSLPQVPGWPDLNKMLNPFAWIADAFGGDIKDIAQRAGLILLGAVLIIVAVWKFTEQGKEFDQKKEQAKDVALSVATKGAA